MDFELSEEQKAIRDKVRALMGEKVAPLAARIDEEGRFPQEVRTLFAVNNLFAVPYPKEYGGSGGSVLNMSIILEEVARVCGSSSMVVGQQCLGSTPILLAGNEDQKRKYFPRLARGEIFASFSLTEPGAGSDVASLSTTAELVDGEYVINGTKCFCTGGDTADVYSLFAKTTNPTTGKKEISCFIVERGTPGFSVGRIEHKMGIRASGTAELICRGARIPKENLLGKEGDGFKIAMMTLDKTRPNVGAQSLGLAQGALDCALAYAKTQTQCGRPLAQQQAIRFKLVDMEAQVQAARNIVYIASDKIDKKASDRTIFSAMSKLLATEVGAKVTGDALQLMGGHGYTREYPVERMNRDSHIFPIVEGTNQIQRLVIARELLGM